MYNELTNEIDDLQYFLVGLNGEPERPLFRSPGGDCGNWDKSSRFPMSSSIFSPRRTNGFSSSPKSSRCRHRWRGIQWDDGGNSSAQADGSPNYGRLGRTNLAICQRFSLQDSRRDPPSECAGGKNGRFS